VVAVSIVSALTFCSWWCPTWSPGIAGGPGSFAFVVCRVGERGFKSIYVIGQGQLFGGGVAGEFGPQAVAEGAGGAVFEHDRGGASAIVIIEVLSIRRQP
jgi:hypothetical protein